jgi:hypothetical protein
MVLSGQGADKFRGFALVGLGDFADLLFKRKLSLPSRAVVILASPNTVATARASPSRS